MHQTFPGQYFDSESGLHYNYFRDYDPTTGSYVEPDPNRLKGAMNTYTYVGGYPIRGIDRRGLDFTYSQKGDAETIKRANVDVPTPTTTLTNLSGTPVINED